MEISFLGSAAQEKKKLLFFINDTIHHQFLLEARKFLFWKGPVNIVWRQIAKLNRQQYFGASLGGRFLVAQLHPREIIDLWLLKTLKPLYEPLNNRRDLISCTEKQVASITPRQREC